MVVEKKKEEKQRVEAAFYMRERWEDKISSWAINAQAKKIGQGTCCTRLNGGLIAWLSSCIKNLGVKLEIVDFSKSRKCNMAATKVKMSCYDMCVNMG